MFTKWKAKLDPKKRYLQVALNSTLEDARAIIERLPISDRIIVEAGTPFIKRYGEEGISQIYDWYRSRLADRTLNDTDSEGAKPFNRELSRLSPALASLYMFTAEKLEPKIAKNNNSFFPYIVADLKTMDRGAAEVEMAVRARASAAVALGNAPIETLNAFIEACRQRGLDPMIDMMNVEYPLGVLRQLKEVPPVVILHRGVDEEQFNKQKQIPLHEIRRIKGAYDIMISIAGGDTIREVQRSIFNDADIVVIWKSVFTSATETAGLVEEFLKQIK